MQAGVFNDRSRAIRIETQSIVNKLNLHEQKLSLKPVAYQMNSRQKDHKNIILFMPRLGNSLRSIDELKINQYAWASFPEINLERDENII